MVALLGGEEDKSEVLVKKKVTGGECAQLTQRLFIPLLLPVCGERKSSPRYTFLPP